MVDRMHGAALNFDHPLVNNESLPKVLKQLFNHDG